MKEEQITALAREYAEWVTEAEGGNNAYIPAEIAMASAFLHWLCDRYCLVDKEKLKRVIKLHIEKSSERNNSSQVWFYHKGSANTLEYLFPEIAKEVEG